MKESPGGRQFLGAPLEVCKRDTSNAFRRVPLRPDYVAISRRQFGAVMSGFSGDLTMECLSRPFGFSASPAIFAM